MDHSSKNKEILERYKSLVQSNYKSLKMETLMTVLKRFWSNYKLTEALNRRKSTSQKQNREDVFKTR